MSRNYDNNQANKSPRTSLWELKPYVAFVTVLAVGSGVLHACNSNNEAVQESISSSGNIPVLTSTTAEEEPDYRTHIVQENDTLFEIAAQDLVGRANQQAWSEDPTAEEIDIRVQQIAEASGIEEPTNIQVGQELRIPEEYLTQIVVRPESR